MALTNKLTDIADAIREKTDTTETMKLDDMPDMIRGIETGGGGASVTYEENSFGGITVNFGVEDDIESGGDSGGDSGGSDTMPDGTVNKVTLNGNTLIDLTQTTATAQSILEGFEALGANGALIEGLMKKGATVEVGSVFASSGGNATTTVKPSLKNTRPTYFFASVFGTLRSSDSGPSTSIRLPVCHADISGTIYSNLVYFTSSYATVGAATTSNVYSGYIMKCTSASDGVTYSIPKGRSPSTPMISWIAVWS